MGPATFSKEKATAPCREVTASNRRVIPLFDGHSDYLCRQHLREALRIVATCADRLIRDGVVA